MKKLFGGVFALAAAADGFKNIIGVESGRNAIAAAKRNAKNLGLNGVTFICDTVAGSQRTVSMTDL